ncbi:hypothetical protein MTR_7g098560 [Medicago truncatula]|uniref:Uncharacterized protein n=1 Tax=Medicago truncatula TaxID=3880 RepID=G7KXG9_MEDTR|nr:hypothetical protein MTR_7g098560 [Medicago truncatula]
MATSCMAFKYTTLSTSCGPGSTSAQRAADWGLVLKTGSETETIWSFSGETEETLHDSYTSSTFITHSPVGKILQALKGIVKLQVIIRGRTVSRQAMSTLKCLQFIVGIHPGIGHCKETPNG